jgi:hypothetical protein
VECLHEMLADAVIIFDDEDRLAVSPEDFTIGVG